VEEGTFGSLFQISLTKTAVFFKVPLMPNKDSAKKYMRVSVKKQEKNDEWRSKISNLERKFHKAVVGNKKEEAQGLAKDLQKALDKAARLRVLHKNTASRNVSRLSAKLQKVK
jgi:small subunit ribosomal protein S20